jgi:ABC-2 type transport system permease protein
MGAFSSGPDKALGGVSLVATYEPVLIAFSLATFALQGVPVVLAGYRERGILRRLNATPVGAGRLLAAQLTVSLGLALVSVAGIVVLGRLAFGVALPGQPAGFCLALVLTAGAMLGLGLLVAALARTGRVAGAVGTMIFLPLMFFAGLWTPRATMSPGLLRVGDYTPLGAAVSALQDTMTGQWPSASGLAVLAGYTVAFGLLAWRLFRWE